MTTRENLLGVRVIRAFNRQKNETVAFEEENSLLVKIQVFVGKISALLNPVTYVIINLAIVAVVWTGGRQVDAGVISQGKVIALVNYMSQILAELIKMANLIILISKAMACMNRVDSVFQVKSSIEDGSFAGVGGEAVSGAAGTAASEAGVAGAAGDSASPDSAPSRVPMVEFDHMDFVYAGAKEPALEDITFRAEPGETIGIIGGTGSGKSTLVNMIPRFYEATRGRVAVNGRDVREYTQNGLRSCIGVVPQRAVLFKGTLRDNMRWGRADASDEDIYRALDMAQAREFVDQKGEGLELWISQEGKNLSGGQRQRLTIARALVRKPDILILDDSASALDFATDARLRSAIRRGTGSMTVFIVSQRAASIKQADRILVLDDGRIAGQGTHRELLRDCSVYREICLSQLSKEEVERDEQ